MSEPTILSPLRFLTCGSVGDGKSTLIGRLLYDSKTIKSSTAGGKLDLTGLVEGLDSEREQNNTIDVSYRSFATAKRSFVVVDTPEGEQYTRNMATGASNSELVVILVDARKGVLALTQRYAYIVSLLGIRNVVLAVNKIDLVDYSKNIFETITQEFSSFAAKLNFKSVVAVPISALDGDNVVIPSEGMPWYNGPVLLSHLEEVDVSLKNAAGPFRLPIEEVKRAERDLLEVSGTIVGGRVALGDAVAFAKSGQLSRIKKMVTSSGEETEIVAGQSATISLEGGSDISRGDVLVDPKSRPEVADQFAAHLLWMGSDELLPHRQYLIKIGTQLVPAQVTQLKHRVDINSLEHLAARTLQLNEVGYCNLSTTEPIIFDRFSENRDMSAFFLIDRATNDTVGAGMVEFGLRRATNVHWQSLDVNADARAGQKQQKPCILWFTGLSGSGKSTIANLIEKRLFAQGRHTYILDGDNVRHGLNQDLGFTDVDRVENIRRVAETAKLFADAGLIVLVSFISPFRSERQLARDLVNDGDFVEIYVDTPIEVCMTRDPKGLYKRAQAGEIKNFTGIDSPYEPPEKPDIVLKTDGVSAEDVAECVTNYLKETGRVL